MKRENFEKSFNVDLDKVSFRIYPERKMAVSVKAIKGLEIVWDLFDGYQLVKNNEVHNFKMDLRCFED